MKNRSREFFLAGITGFAVAMTLMACNAEGQNAEAQPTAEYQEITAEKAKERMDSDDNVVVLDVRTEEEYEEAHIPGAVLIPNETITDQILEQNFPDYDQEILVYCRSGSRSAQAARKLAEAGYTQVYDLGGIRDWPYETQSGAADTF